VGIILTGDAGYWPLSPYRLWQHLPRAVHQIEAFVVVVYCPLRRREGKCRGRKGGQGEGQRKGKGNDEVRD